MEFEFTWIDPSIVVSHPTGEATVDGFAELLSALTSEPRFGPGTKILADLRALDTSSFGADDVEHVADFRLLSTGGLKIPAALVVGAGSPARFGLARMFGAQVDSRAEGTMRVFERREEGIAWLRSLGSEAAARPSTGETGAGSHALT